MTLVLLAACGEADPVVIAAPGDWADGGSRLLRQGMELARDEVNASGGVGGRRLVLDFVELGRADVMQAAVLARELVDRPDVMAVVGHTGSASAAVALSVYDGSLPAVLPLASSSAWSRTPSWSFRLSVAPSDYARTVVQLREDRGWERVAVLFDNTPHARATADAVRSAFGDATLFQPLYTVEILGSHEPIVEAVLDRGVDAIFLMVGERNAGTLVPLIRSMDGSVPIVGDWWPSLMDAHEFRRIHVVTAGFTTPEGELRDTAFVARFSRAHGEPPETFAAYGYDAVRLVAQAADEAAVDRSAIRDWLDRLEAGDVPPGVTGPLAFDSTGERVGRDLSIRLMCGAGVPAATGSCR